MMPLYHLPESIVGEYRQGDSATTIATRYSTTPSTVLARLKRYGVTIRKHQREPITSDIEDPHRIIQLICTNCGKSFEREYLSNKNIIRQKGHNRAFCSPSCSGKWYHNPIELPNSVIEEYEQGDSIESLADRYEVATGTIGNFLHKHNIAMRTPGGGRETGWHHSDEAKEKIRAATIAQFSRPGAREEGAHRTTRAIVEGKIRKSSLLEDRVAIELSRRGIAFQRQVGIRNPETNRYCACADFLLLDGTIIEVNGTFWHTDPRKYPNGPIHESQKRVAENYTRKMEILAKLHIPVIELWEVDLTANFTEAIDKAMECITHNS